MRNVTIPASVLLPTQPRPPSKAGFRRAIAALLFDGPIEPFARNPDHEPEPCSPDVLSLYFLRSDSPFT